VPGIAMFVGAGLTRQWPIAFILAGGGILMLFSAVSFQTLTVRDDGDSLRIQFGPLPLLGKTIRYADIDTVTRGRTSLIEGWGIHLSPGGGWTWNLWGFDCVDFRLKDGRRTRIGTDDPAGLEEFLKAAVSSDGDPAR